MVVESMWLTTGSTAETAMHPAASICAPRPAAELAGEQAGEQDDDPGHHRRREPQPDQRTVEEGVEGVREQAG